MNSNYRPVSLLNAFSKIIEKVVFTRVYNFLLDISFLNPLQSYVLSTRFNRQSVGLHTTQS